MSVYLTRGRQLELDPQTNDAEDALFVNQRFDDETLSAGHFRQCTFANVSFKDAKLIDCHFSACVFEGCYFRGTTLRECNFPASRFIDCEFPKVNVYSCSFANTRFRRSAPRFTLIEASLPGEPNLCEVLCENLATEAAALGHDKEARSYRLRAIEAREDALRRGYRWLDQYSRNHYPEWERPKAFFELCLSRLSGWLWGHGEYARRLLGNLALIALVFGPLLFLIFRSHLHGGSSVGDCYALSVASVLNDSSIAGVDATGICLWISLALSAFGLVFLGLFVTYVFRAVTRR
jgi:hypothetical protein